MSRSNNKVASVVVGVLLGAVVIAIIGLLMLVMTGLSVGAANSWILQGNFTDGWTAVWDRWLVALGWAILFGGGASGASVGGSNKKG